MVQYRTSGVIDEAALKEIIGIFIPRWYHWLTRGFSIFAVLLAVLWGFVLKNVGFAGLCLVFAVLLASYPAFHRRRYFKMSVAQMKEQAGSLSLPTESFFNIDGLAVLNQTTGNSALLRYEDIAFVRESRRYFTVMTKGQRFSLIFKDCLTDEQKKNIIHDLKQHCPKLKVRK